MYMSQRKATLVGVREFCFTPYEEAAQFAQWRQAPAVWHQKWIHAYTQWPSINLEYNSWRVAFNEIGIDELIFQKK